MPRSTRSKLLAKPPLHAITLQGQQINYRLRRSAAARTCRLHVSSGEVLVVLPRRAAEKHATNLLQDQADWVLKHLRKANQQLSASLAAAGLKERQILLRGRPVDVAVQWNQTPRPLVTATDSRITIRLGQRHDDPIAPLEAFLRNQARRELLTSVEANRRSVRVQPACITVRDQKTRWGSCSSSRTLSFSWRLLMTPPAVLDYVVIHELVHLDIPDHSQRFWSRVEKLCPAYDTHRQWLRTHESVVMRPLSACSIRDH